MDEQHLEELVRKFADGSATIREVEQLNNWYRSGEIGDVLWSSENPSEKEKLHSRMLRRLHMDPGFIRKTGRLAHISWLKVAASIFLIAGVVILALYLSFPSSKAYYTVTNPSGKIKLVLLPDSSRVWLNASTTLRYEKAFTKNRGLELRGEAYFEVKHDDSHPFIVKAGELQTTVLGTTFNIKAYETDDIINVSVISGKVKVQSRSESPTILSPSLQLQYNRKAEVSNTAKVDTNAIVAWTKGKLEFNGETLAEIARTLERWYGVQFSFSDPSVRSCRYYMSFENTITLDKLLQLMTAITEMKYEVNTSDNLVTISGEQCH